MTEERERRKNGDIGLTGVRVQKSTEKTRKTPGDQNKNGKRNDPREKKRLREVEKKRIRNQSPEGTKDHSTPRPRGKQRAGGAQRYFNHPLHSQTTKGDKIRQWKTGRRTGVTGPPSTVKGCAMDGVRDQWPSNFKS